MESRICWACCDEVGSCWREKKFHVWLNSRMYLEKRLKLVRFFVSFSCLFIYFLIFSVVVPFRFQFNVFLLFSVRLYFSFETCIRVERSWVSLPGGLGSKWKYWNVREIREYAAAVWLNRQECFSYELSSGPGPKPSRTPAQPAQLKTSSLCVSLQRSFWKKQYLLCI